MLRFLRLVIAFFIRYLNFRLLQISFTFLLFSPYRLDLFMLYWVHSADSTVE